MGKGDKKSRRGKIIIGTFGVRRPRRLKSTKAVAVPPPVAKKPKEKVKKAEEIVVEAPVKVPVDIPAEIPVEVPIPEVIPEPVVQAVVKEVIPVEILEVKVKKPSKKTVPTAKAAKAPAKKTEPRATAKKTAPKKGKEDKKTE